MDDFSTGRRKNVNEEAEIIEGDVWDRETLRDAMADVDIVFHHAAISSVTRSIEEPVRSNEVNLDATLGVLEAARKQSSRVVLASSSAIYGRPAELPLRETTGKRPTTPYGIQKLSIDQYARTYHRQYGLETVALRYFNVYGPRQASGHYSGVIPTFGEQARNGEPITVEGDGEQTRDFVHVDDVVRANLLAATTDQVGEAFNIGGGQSITVRRLAEIVQDIVDSDSPVVHTEPRDGDIRRSEADISKARRELGYEPTISLVDGLESLL